jgi:hypothetical protein
MIPGYPKSDPRMIDALARHGTALLPPQAVVFIVEMFTVREAIDSILTNYAAKAGIGPRGKLPPAYAAEIGRKVRS